MATVAPPQWNWPTRLTPNELADHWHRIETIDNRLSAVEQAWWIGREIDQLVAIITEAWSNGRVYDYVLAHSYLQIKEGDEEIRGRFR